MKALSAIIVFLAAGSALWAEAQPQTVGLGVGNDRISLSVERQEFQFTRAKGLWALDEISVDGRAVARPLSRIDSFFAGSGEASGFEVITNEAGVKAVRFQVCSNKVVYSAVASDPLPAIHVEMEGPENPVWAVRTAAVSQDEHGAWVTRGWVATDADGKEVFVDASNPLVFGHATAGQEDVSYVFRAVVNPNRQSNGRTEQRTQTWFKSARMDIGGGSYAGLCQIRMGQNEPKEFAVVFDGNVGGRFGSVCEKYYAAAVDSLMDLGTVASSFDATRCVEVMPLRLASPDAFIPGLGWMMDEYPGASYPFAHDCVWQQGAFLVLEGVATGRDWERNLGKYILDRTPLEGKPGSSYFVRKPGGLTRWGYFTSYRKPFPPLDGGTWWTADILYRTAKLLNDGALRQASLDMIRHDLNVKLDLERMRYPPCWDPVRDQIGEDHRDDWFATPGLAYCAYVASAIAYPETHDRDYLAKCDRICEWFAEQLYPEAKENFLQGNNMYATFSHYLTLAFLGEYDRTADRRFLDMARDAAWVHIMTLATIPGRDRDGRPLAGVTCVGVRGCVDYDCSPNLCQEKDLTFVHIIGPLLDHFAGPGYAKYVGLQRLTLDKDSWGSAWAADLRETNLRTMYDTYARGTANLIQAMEVCDDPHVDVIETRVSKSDAGVLEHRQFIIANGTPQDRETRLRAQYLKRGKYRCVVDGKNRGTMTSEELRAGIAIRLRANSMVHGEITPIEINGPERVEGEFDSSVTYLSDLEPFGAQRGINSPQPTYQKDKSLDGGVIRMGDRRFDKGVGCGADTALVYALDGKYARFKATVGIANEMKDAANPKPSAFVTVHVDGVGQFESGPILAEAKPKEVDIDVRNARTLMLRVSCNWDDNGNGIHDHIDWADARLVGKRTP